jgi:hypothetical protein
MSLKDSLNAVKSNESFEIVFFEDDLDIETTRQTIVDFLVAQFEDVPSPQLAHETCRYVVALFDAVDKHEKEQTT